MWIILIIYITILSLIATKKIKYKNYILDFKSLKKDKTSLMLSLGTKVGVGSIIGTVSSILIGGYSSIIWIIISSLLFSSLIYKESYLSYNNRIKNRNEYIGGMYFILKKDNKKLAIISLIILIVLYTFLFQMIQMNTIVNIINLNIKINKELLTIIIIIILLITTSLSVKEILNSLNKIVPIMLLIFIAFCTYKIVLNYNTLINNINIFSFSFKSIFSGLVVGIKRSIFMNETLIGTTSVSSASDKNDIKTATNYQVLGTYFISIVFTLLISSLLLIYKDKIIISDYNLVINLLFKNMSPNFGTYILIIIITLFGFTTILSGFYIGKIMIEYLSNNKIINAIFKILFIMVCTSGIFIKNNILWKYTDTLIFIIIIINSYSIIKSLGSDKNDR